MKSYDENLKILKSITPKWELNERVALTNALNRVLADDIIAQAPHPAYPTSAMDGYAIKFDNQNSNTITMKQISAHSPAKKTS